MSDKLNKIFHRDLFQVGDVVEIKGQKAKIKIPDSKLLNNKFKIKPTEVIITYIDNWGRIQVHHWNYGNLGFRSPSKLTPLLFNVTLSDVLIKFQEVRKFHTTLEISNKGYLTYWESVDPDKTKQVDWILRKNLWNQSDECKKFIQEILE